MFTFSDTPVTFTVLLLLFALCTAWCSYESIRPQNGRQRVSSVLHLAMAVVMLLMVTGPTWALLTAVLPAGWLAAGFAAATLWFGFLTFDALARRNQAGGWHGAGHAAMFAAMTWHLAAMAVMGGMDHSGMGVSHMNGGGADMPTWIAEQSLPGGTLWILALIGLPLMAYLLIASLRSLWKVVRPATLAPEHPREPAGRRDPDCTSADQHVAGEEHPREEPDGGTVALATSPTTTLQPGCHQAPRPGSNTYRLATLSDFAMTFGMFWMSTGLLLPILPLLAVLSF